MKWMLAGMAGLALLLCGCGESLPSTVTGKITIDGQALPDSEGVTGNVVFYPTGGGAPGFGTVKSGGEYRLSTGSTSGIQPGNYKVTVRVVEIPPEPPGGHAAAPTPKPLSPPRYSDADKTDLEVTVTEGTNTHDFDLTSK